MPLNIVDFPLCYEGTMMLTGSLIQMRQNLLVVMYLHLGMVQLHGDQPDKLLLQDQQWNLSLLLSEFLSKHSVRNETNPICIKSL